MSDNTAPIQSPLGTPNRYTTTHDPTTKKAIFSRTLPEPVAGYGAGGMIAFDTYKTFTQPFTMTGEADIAALQAHGAPDPAGGIPKSIWFPDVSESLLRYCDFGPGMTLPMHRTETLDLGVCVAGRMEVTLDSGEKRMMCPGDTIVQRGTMHAWRNPSETEWSRAVFFILGAKPVEVGGEVMGEVMLFGGEEEKAKEC